MLDSLDKRGRWRIAGGHKSRGGLCVPLFVYPSSEGLQSWEKVAATICSHNLQDRSYVVVNPDNGDFGIRGDQLAPADNRDCIARERVNPDFAKACRLLRSHNIETLGYVYTGYGARPLEIVRDRIDLYHLIYGTNGILLDEMARERGKEKYYSSINAIAKNLGMSRVVGNPGTSIAESYVETLDTLIVYEKDGYSDLDKIEERTFNGRYPAEKFGLVLHSLSYYSPEWVKNASKLARYLYLTGGNSVNPYDSVSEYLDLLARDLSGK